MASLRATALLALACAACGAFSSEATPPGDAGSGPDAPSVVDASVNVDGQVPDGAVPDAGACDHTKPFQAPTSLELRLTSLTRRTMALPAPDELTVYVTADTGAADGVFYNTRASVDAPFGEPSLLEGDFNSGGASRAHPSITDDGTAIYYARGTQPSSVIHVATRPRKGTRFDNGSNVSGLGGTGASIDPYVTPDGATIYFADDSGMGNGLDIFVAERGAGPASFKIPSREDGISSVAEERAPIASRDQLTLFFARKVSGVYRVFVATRAAKSAPFGGAVALSVLDAPTDTLPMGLSADGCTLYLAVESGNNAAFKIARRGP
jgi:hypothetical protein